MWLPWGLLLLSLDFCLIITLPLLDAKYKSEDQFSVGTIMLEGIILIGMIVGADCLANHKKGRARGKEYLRDNYLYKTLGCIKRQSLKELWYYVLLLEGDGSIRMYQLDEIPPEIFICKVNDSGQKTMEAVAS